MSDIRIILMNGGLGNQLFQYTFMRYIELSTGSTCLVDDSAFWNGGHVEHNGYELEKVFGIKLNLLSDFFSQDVWEEMMRKKAEGVSVPQQLKDNGMDIMLVAEAQDFKFDGNYIFFDPGHIDEGTLMAFTNTRGNIYYHGYWVNRIYWSIVRKYIREELHFPEIRETLNYDTVNRKYAELMVITNSVALHIRRGDFVNCGRVVAPEKYKKAINILENKYSDCTYFVFSDDIAWCRENEEALGIEDIKGDIIYVTENMKEKRNYIDMQLMSMCKRMIISNSSFGTWAYYLNINEDVEVISVNGL